MFAIPAPTAYDLKFSLLNIPIRVHPLFWVMAAALGWRTHERFDVLVWIACVFVSIIVHEFGHALAARSLSRARPGVILYLMGGLCVYDTHERPWRRAGVLAMGPGAGFILFGLILGLGLAVLGIADVWPVGLIQVHRIPTWFFQLPEWLIRVVYVAYHDLLWINLFWGLFNLLPIYPLDGGQLAVLFLSMHDRREGPSRGYLVGVITAGGLAIYFATMAIQTHYDGYWINAFFIANLAFANYQLLQASHYQKSSSSYFEENDDWWRK